MTIHNFCPKIVFFDIDDTLSRNGVLAPHNKSTLEALASTDVKVVIATGRPKPFLPPDVLQLFDAGMLDAIICTNGQYSFDQQGVIAHYPLSQTQVDDIVQICEQHGVLYKFDSANHMAWIKIDDYVSKFALDRPNAIVDPEYHQQHTVYQCSVFFSSDQADLDVSPIKNTNFDEQGLKLVLWHHMGGDILPIDASKARAVQDVCRYFDLDVADAVAFGDGFNDIEMFDVVGHAVAMGDAQPALIERADQVTGTIEEQGIQAVLTELGLL